MWGGVPVKDVDILKLAMMGATLILMFIIIGQLHDILEAVK